jgi:3-hydroxyisobutyrate dehydrogenase-like beta-hydroxyacid dehydrogenase
MTQTNAVRICFIGFGEAGQAIAAGLREAGAASMSAWDILFPQAEGERLRQAGARIGVRLAASAADAVRSSDVVVSAVTAAASLDAARSVAAHLSGQIFSTSTPYRPDASRRRRASFPQPATSMWP